MKRILLRIVVVLGYLHFTSCIEAQTQKDIQGVMDSMKTTLKKTSSDSVKVDILLGLTERYWSVNPPDGLPYAHQALLLIQKMKWKEKLADAYGELGMNHSMISNNDSAVFYLEKSVKVSEELKNPKLIARACGALGNVYYFQSKYPQAIELYLKASKASEQAGDSITIAACMSNIGSIYLNLNDWSKALPNFEKALALNRKTGMKIYESVNLSNIGLVYWKKDEAKLALQYYLKSLDINKEIQDRPGIAGLMTPIGNAYKKLGALDSAYDYIQRGLQLAQEVQALHDIAFTYYSLASILYDAVETNNTNFLNKHFSGLTRPYLMQAKIWADSSVTTYLSIQEVEKLSDAYLLLSNIYDKLGNCTNALLYYRKYTATHDSVFNMDNAKKLTQKTMQYDFDKKEAASKVEQEKKDIRQRNIRYSITSGLIGTLFFLIIVYRQRNKIKKEKQLSEELLLNILPAEITDELKQRGETTAKNFENVTVLFTDFVEFTKIGEKLSPQVLVQELHECFSEFDSIMERNGLEKIKTVGDAYIAVCGLPVPNELHAEKVVQAAKQIIQFMEERKRQEKVFEIRVGIHTGPVVAGIVGVKKFAYDIWGDTVNTASRMESSGEAGKINISRTTYELVKDKFSSTHRGKISAKGKGEIDMYFVEC